MSDHHGEGSELTCPACGAWWPSNMRFCGACGTALSAEPPSEELAERKIVTALFADLAASTELASRLDPEDLRAILRPFFEAMVEEIERFGGTVQKFIGDAIVAVFGVPVAHEDDPERAVRAALAMQRRLPAVNEELRAGSGQDLAMRIGVNTGEVVTATGVDRQALVTGEAINVAARFEALADPGSVVVGERTYRDTLHAIRYRSLGEVRVKGIDRPLGAWEAMAERNSAGPTAPGRVGLAPLVGRDEELALLDLLFARVAREGRPGLATLVGPAGIGKSRLSKEFIDRMSSRQPVRVVKGRCLAYGEGLTYWPLAEILKADAGVLDSDPPDAFLPKAEAILGSRFASGEEAAVHTRILLASIGIAEGPDPLAGADPVAARESIGRSWRAYFDSLADGQPAIALIEDLHWADDSLLDLLEDVAARGTRAVMLLCTTRPDLTERRSTWGGGLRSSTTIPLSPLSDQEGERLIRHLLGGLPAPEDAMRRILDRAEGNPFFAQELLRMVVESGSLVRDDEAWILARPLPETLPDTVQGVLASRMDMTPPAEKRALQDAAVVGRVFWQGAVAALGSPDAGTLLDGLIDRGLLWEQPSSQIAGEREFVFNHVLTQDVAYTSIPKSRRRHAHAAALGWVEEVTEGRAEEFAEILAHHAERAGDTERTARYGTLAGHRSRRLFAAREAIRWYDRALAATAAAPDRMPLLEAGVLLARGEALEQLGSFDPAESDYRQAVNASEKAGDGLLRARALAALAHLHWLQDRFDAGREVLERALDQARKVEANELLAQILYTAGTLAFGQGKYEEALGRHEEALRVALEAGDQAGEAMARHGLCETLYFLGPLDRALEEGQEADRLFRTMGQRPMVYHNLYMVAWLLWFKGRLGEAITAFDESAEGSNEIGNRRDEGFALAGAHVRALAGEIGEALRRVRAAVDIAVEIQTPRLELAARGMTIQILLEAGAPDAVQAELDRAMEITDAIGTNFARPRLLSMAGWLALRAHDPSAQDLLATARATTEGVLLEDLWTGWVEVAAAEDQEDAGMAREAGQRLARRAREDSPFFEAWGRYGEVLADDLEGRWEQALEGARDLLERSSQMGDRTLQWRSAAVSSRALSMLGMQAESEAERSRAVSIVEAAAIAIDDPGLRSSFLARPMVAEILAEGSTTTLLAGIPPHDLDDLWSSAEMRRLEDGEAVFRRGDPADAVYFIQQGSVTISAPGHDGEAVLARLGPSDFAGEVAVLSDAPRTADAIAVGASSVLRIGREDFLRFLEERPLVAERLLTILSRRLEEDSASLTGSSMDDLAASLTEAMQRLAQTEGRTTPAIEVLPVYVRDGSVRWLRPAGGGSILIDAPSGGHPGDAVVAALQRYGLEPDGVHSTSWRTANGRLVVTYLALLPPLDVPPPGLRRAEVHRSDLARGSATGAPPRIEVDQVIEHALRHFAWLLKDDPVIKERFARTWTQAIADYVPEPFRSIDPAAAGA